MDKLRDECLATAREKKTIEEDKLAEFLQVLDELQDICEQIDFAMSLCQIGGMPALLEMCHPATGLPDELRASALGVIATVTQNNPYTQNALYNLNALPLMIGIATGSSGVPLRLKAIHAISCMVRSFPLQESVFFTGDYPSITNFTEDGKFVEHATSTAAMPVIMTGPQVLSLFISDSDIKIRRKGAFLVGALITQDGLASEMLDGYYNACIQGLVSLVSPLSASAGEEGGLEVDIREITLRTLTSFAQKGKGGDLLSQHGELITSSYASAKDRVTAGVDVENSQAEIELWDALFAASQ